MISAVNLTQLELEEEETSDWDDIFEAYKEEEPIERSMMEHLLFGTYWELDDDNELVQQVPYELDEWLALWREYVKLDKANNAIWTFVKKLKTWDEVERILENLENIKDEDEELFEELFTSNFVSCFLYELLQGKTDVQLKVSREREIKKIAAWIQKHKAQAFSQNDFWRVLLHFEVTNAYSSPRLYINDSHVEYSRLWRVCCLTPIYISFKDEMQKNSFCVYTTERLENGFYKEVVESELEALLNFCDGVIDNEMYENNAVFDKVLEMENKEMLYRSLKKNFFSRKTMDYALTSAVEKGIYEVIPMLMLKKHGEWPEGVKP